MTSGINELDSPFYRTWKRIIHLKIKIESLDIYVYTVINYGNLGTCVFYYLVQIVLGFIQFSETYKRTQKPQH